VTSSGASDPDDRFWLEQAVDLSRRCPPSLTAFSVGALVVGGGRVLATGFSREQRPHDHAEAVAIRRALEAGVSLVGAALYSSLEPCASRASGRRSCCDRIAEAGLRRVVFACEEPPIFVPGQGAARLRELGIEVVQLADLAPAVREINAHLAWETSPRR
jgi:pyrimidine deaminase RibD-like protein